MTDVAGAWLLAIAVACVGCHHDPKVEAVPDAAAPNSATASDGATASSTYGTVPSCALKVTQDLCGGGK